MSIFCSYYTITRNQSTFVIQSNDGTEFMFHPNANLSALSRLTENGGNYLINDDNIFLVATDLGYEKDTMNAEEFKTFFLIQRRRLPITIYGMVYSYSIIPVS